MSARDGIVRLTTSTPDFPEPGVLFRDLTPVFADPGVFAEVVHELSAPFASFDAVAGIDARGFLLAGAVGFARGRSVITVRKAGKLPLPTLREEYALEYGTAALEVHDSVVPPGSRVLIIDDVLATGGTVAAAARLIERGGWIVAGVGVVLEITELKGRAQLPGIRVHALHSV